MCACLYVCMYVGMNVLMRVRMYVCIRGVIKCMYVYTVCNKKMVQSEKIIQDMIFVQNLCVFGTISKRNNCSFCCFLNHIICFCKSRVMLRFVWQGKIPFVALFIYIE